MRLGLIGAGNMASALARGIGEPVLVCDIDAGKAKALAEELGGRALATNVELAEQADAVVLCHKPKQLAEVAEEVAPHAKALVSILAGVSTSALEEAYPGVPVYRFIPNIPAEVRRGVLCYVSGTRAGNGPEREILDLFGRVGTVIPLSAEPLIEPAMALMSCGPAFMALVAAINFRGVSESVKVNVILTLIELTGLLIIIAIGAWALGRGVGDTSRLMEFDTADGRGAFGAVTAATALAFFAMVGFEDSVNMAEETKDPVKIFPKVMLLGLCITGVIYILVSISSVALVTPEDLG